MTRWRTVRRCVVFGMGGAAIGFVLAFVVGAAVAYAIYPGATQFLLTSTGGAATSHVERAFDIQLVTIACGVLMGFLASQTALIIEAMQSRGRGATHCENCGYDFRGHATPSASRITCPECGTVAAA